MRKFTEYIGSQFGNPRGIVGKICCFIMNRINNEMYKNVILEVQKKKDLCILDIGYGNGYLIEEMFKNTHSRIYGIDISNDMLKLASDRNKEGVQAGEITLSLGNCCNLNFNNNTFEIVTSVNTIYFWQDTLKGLTEIHRVLKEGGAFYNAVYSKEWLQRLSYTRKGFKFFEKEDYMKLGKQAGFSEILIKEIINGRGYFIEFKK